MSGIKYFSEVLNQRNTPALYQDTLTNRPAASFAGRIFFATNITSGDSIFRDTGTTWQPLASVGGITGATNGLQIISGNVGLGGTLTQNTNISCFGSFTFRIESFLRFDIGNGSELGFTVDNTNLITFSRNTVGNAAGIYLDYNNNIFNFGEPNLATYFQAYAGINEIRTYCVGNTYGLNCTQTYVKVGEWSGSGINLSTTYDFSTNRISNFSGDGYYNFANIPAYANNAAALGAGLLVGDIYRHTGGGGEALHIVF